MLSSIAKSCRCVHPILRSILVSGLLAASTLAQGDPSFEDQMGAMRGVYDAACQTLKNRAAQPLESVKGSYLEALDQLGARFADNRDPDALRVLRREQERMRGQTTLPLEAVVDWPKELRSVQRLFLNRFDQALYPSCRKMVQLNDTYGQMLERLANTEPDPVAVSDRIQEEFDRANADPLLDFSRNVCGRVEPAGVEEVTAVGEPDGTANPPGEDPANVVAAVPDVEPQVQFYPVGQAPLKNVKNYSLQFTGRQSRAAIGFADALVGVYAESGDLAEETKIKSKGLVTRQGYVRYVPRIQLKCLSTSGLKDNILSISYVTRSLFQSLRGDRKVEKVENISLPAVKSGESLVIDPVGVRLFRRESGREVGQFSQGQGRELFGLVISIFNQQGTLLYQRATHSSLEEFATTALPRAGTP